MFEFLRHFFTPHHTNNQRAKLLHYDFIFSISAIFFIFAFCLSIFRTSRPDILGISVNISTQELITLTNKQRQIQGLKPLSYNPQLALAAKLKADDMFKDNYWAHISTKTGRTPWVFIQKSEYQYIYAGENLARGFNNANDAVLAWMASPTHKANVLSPNYQDVGFAVESGTLTGEPDTVLIVEMFGGKISSPLDSVSPQDVKQQVLSDHSNGILKSDKLYALNPFIDRFSFSKNIVQIILGIFIFVFLLDIVFIKRKNITRIVGHNLDHILFIGGLLLAIALIKAGRIN